MSSSGRAPPNSKKKEDVKRRNLSNSAGYKCGRCSELKRGHKCPYHVIYAVLPNDFSPTKETRVLCTAPPAKCIAKQNSSSRRRSKNKDETACASLTTVDSTSPPGRYYCRLCDKPKRGHVCDAIPIAVVLLESDDPKCDRFLQTITANLRVALGDANRGNLASILVHQSTITTAEHREARNLCSKSTQKSGPIRFSVRVVAQVMFKPEMVPPPHNTRSRETIVGLPSPDHKGSCEPAVVAAPPDELLDKHPLATKDLLDAAEAEGVVSWTKQILFGPIQQTLTTSSPGTVFRPLGNGCWSDVSGLPRKPRSKKRSSSTRTCIFVIETVLEIVEGRGCVLNVLYRKKYKPLDLSSLCAKPRLWRLASRECFHPLFYRDSRDSQVLESASQSVSRDAHVCLQLRGTMSGKKSLLRSVIFDPRSRFAGVRSKTFAFPTRIVKRGRPEQPLKIG